MKYSLWRVTFAMAVALLAPGCFESSFAGEVTLSVTPHYVLFVGDTVQIVASAKYKVTASDPEYRYRSNEFPEQWAWESSNPAVATVNSDGVVRGVTAGMTNIAATFQNVTATYALRVTPFVESIVLEPSRATLSAPDTLSVQITTLGAQQQPVGPVPLKPLESGMVAMTPFLASVEAPTRLVYRVFSAGQHTIIMRLDNVRAERTRSTSLTVTATP